MRPLTSLLAICALVSPAALGSESSLSHSPEQAEIRELLRSEQTAEADALERQLLEEIARTEGRRSLAYVDELDELVEIRVEVGRLTGPTLKLARQAVAMRASIQGRDSPDLLPALAELAYLLHVDGALEAARDTYRWSLDLSRSHFGSISQEFAQSLAGLASVEADLGDRRRGEEFMRQSVAILEDLYGLEDPQITDALFRLALLLYDQERFEEAIEIWTRTLEIFERPENRNDEQLARSHHNLGEAHYRLGQIERAFEYLERALRLRLRLDQPGEPPMPQFPSTYSTLADLAQDVGEFQRARGYYLAALEGLRRWSGEDPYRYTQTLSHLALLEAQTGAWAEALEHQEQALEIRRAKLGAQDPLVARVLQRLGSFHLERGEIERASDRLREALAIHESNQTPEPSSLAATLTSLGVLAEYQGNTTSAMNYLGAALAELRGLDMNHPARVEPLARLARLQRRQGQTGEGSRLAQEGLDAAAASFGSDSPRTLYPAQEKAIVEALLGDPEQARQSALRLESIRREHLRATIRSYPERQALLFTETDTRALDIALTVLDRWGPEADPLAIAEVWDAVVRSRALVLDAVASRQRLLAASADPRLGELAAEVAEARTRLADLLVRGRGNLPASAHERLVGESRLSLAEAERLLAEASRPFLEEERQMVPGLDEVVEALPENTALVAVVRFRRFGRNKSGAIEGEPYYAVFLHRGGAKEPQFLPLGAATLIDAAIRAWRAGAEQGLTGGAKAEERFRALGLELRRQVWEPFAVHLRGEVGLFLVPDGSLHLMNPAALPDEPDRYLIESDIPTLHFLTAERDLATQRVDPPAGRGLLAMGGPDFFDRERPIVTDSSSGVPLERSRALGWTGCRPFESHEFEPLPGTLSEIGEIAGVWQRAMTDDDARKAPGVESVAPLTGAEATEAAFKKLAPGRRAVHLATHGFFLQGECGSPAIRFAADRHSGGATQEPLALSGLAFAGANRRAETLPGEEDGILTALEISGLDLTGVQWAVLSACDSGLGRVRTAEGVFGLRRAFAVAGARTVIMSLWKVGDESTREWMRRFYSRKFEYGEDTASALRGASLEVLNQRRSAGLSTHPVFWAAFIASGDWR